MKKKNKIEGIRFHDLRHEAISRMFDSGMSAPEVASISGHKTTSMRVIRNTWLYKALLWEPNRRSDAEKVSFHSHQG